MPGTMVMSNMSTQHINKVATTILYEDMPEWRNGRRSGFKICSNYLPRVFTLRVQNKEPIKKGLLNRIFIKFCVATITLHSLSFAEKVTIYGTIDIW